MWELVIYRRVCDGESIDLMLHWVAIGHSFRSTPDGIAILSFGSVIYVILNFLSRCSSALDILGH